jgi:anti-anti-sigma regulatory factor
MDGEAASKNTKKKRALSIKCADTLTIALVQEYYGKLDKALSEERAVIIEASAVERIDAAMLQLFCAYRFAAQEKGLALRWKGVSEAVDSSARLLGVHAAIGLEEAA